jgi:hypothetical protein
MTTRFCFYCGHGPLDIYDNGLNQKGFKCSICSAAFEINTYIGPRMTLEEAQAVFDKIPLTDYQRTGRANTGKWARKKKKSLVPIVEK